jgi:FkbM family methyltransferase
MQSISIVRDGAELQLTTVNALTTWRARTAVDKEPGTLAWIDEMSSGDVLVDIGANVGLYGLYAARFRGVRVFAFEPESQNFALLNTNIHRNKLQDAVLAYCLALSDETRFDSLYLSTFEAGAACHTFGESLRPDGAPMAAGFRQGCFATTLDALVQSGAVPVPRHIKIDVDGIEHKVIRGAAATLADRRVASVLVEINAKRDDHWAIVDFMLEQGFSYSEEEAQRAIRTTGAFVGTGNYVFRR